ncbi:MAG: DUF4173 domain-containing protein [Planctomycetaceae bacterium]|jgi:hypothetical protein|nr:DUF4173 domain-containing protein [Planctomycetaceae bacterium]
MNSDVSFNSVEDFDPDVVLPSPPVLWRELAAVLGGVVLVDVTLYHGAGFAGIAAMLFGWSLLFWLGVSKPSVSGKILLIFALLFVTAVKLIWCGFFSTAVAGFVLLFFFGMVQTGRRLSFAPIIDYFFQIIFGSIEGFTNYRKFFVKRGVRIPSGTWLAVGLPLLAVVIFGTIFVAANPSLVDLCQRLFDKFIESFWNISNIFPAWTQVFCWFLAAWILTGMIRPLQDIFILFEREVIGAFKHKFSLDSEQTATTPIHSPYYVGYRNMLFAVIVLFMVYLVFEFKTLWFRDFPAGFCYSDYSHHGAAWLVVGLALSTVILSMVFTTEMYRDPRIATLRRLAWIWSILNFVLALAVYNRLFLYINFNGMTRMRVIGLLGMTAVLLGFIMVVRKITEQRSFGWLLTRFAWTVLVMVFLDFVLPVDWLVHRYNVARILKGDYAPAVQISVHPCSNEGYLTFLPLATDCQDEVIRNGIRALLLQKFAELDCQNDSRQPNGKYFWTKYQLADQILFRQLNTHRKHLENSDSGSDPDQLIRHFKDYVYQWY